MRRPNKRQRKILGKMDIIVDPRKCLEKFLGLGEYRSNFGRFGGSRHSRVTGDGWIEWWGGGV